MMLLTRAKIKSGFSKNPLSIFYTEKHPHVIGDGRHETERNQQLIRSFTDEKPSRPALYPDDESKRLIAEFNGQPYITIAPGSVWFTKTFPKEKWIDFIKKYGSLFPERKIYLIGSAGEFSLAEEIVMKSGLPRVINLCGKLPMLASAALMKNAIMNYANDSAPVHIAGAVNAPVTEVYCSTVPAFGFGPLSDKSFIVETSIALDCRPCGLHGYAACPLGHFNCAHTIDTDKFFLNLKEND
jgi:heptosyltransferase-2